jgi:hypothetical protein
VEPEARAGLAPEPETPADTGDAASPAGLRLEYQLSESKAGSTGATAESGAGHHDVMERLPPDAQLGDAGGAPLDAEETARFRQDLARRPPEEIPAGGTSVADPPCDLCWGIIYRPLSRGESL